MSYVYFLRPIGMAGPIKIGHSFTPWERLRTCLTWSPLQLELIAMTPGGEPLELRLHAHFAHLHSHGEWFRAGPDLSALIETVITGQFDPTPLPAPRRLRTFVPPPESIEAAKFTRSLSALQYAGVEIPAEVQAATFTYQLAPAEVARRRAVVREFVERHSDLLPEARRNRAANHANWQVLQKAKWQAEAAARQAAA